MQIGRRGRLIFAVAAVLAAADVGLRAWAAHGLASRLDTQALHLFDTARGHQFGVALGLFFTSIRMHWGGRRLATLAAWTFIAGGALFCGDVYQAAFSADHAAVGIAPAGGSLTILAWLLLATDAVFGAGTQI